MESFFFGWNNKFRLVVLQAVRAVLVQLSPLSACRSCVEPPSRSTKSPIGLIFISSYLFQRNSGGSSRSRNGMRPSPSTHQSAATHPPPDREFTMPWGLGSSSSAPTGSSNDDDKKTPGNRIKTATQDGARSLKDGVVGHFSKAGNWISPAVAVGSTLGLWVLWQRYLRRIPGTAHIPPEYLHRRSLFGKVTSVGDGDGFHFYHTPGGRLAGWGWLRGVPKTRKELKGNTVSYHKPSPPPRPPYPESI